MFGFISSLFKSQTVDSAKVEEIRNDIKKEIQDNKVLVYSKTYCPYCRSSKELLSSKNMDYKVIELDQVEDGPTIQNVLREITGQRTVPNIFIDGKHIGGNSDLQSLKF